MEEDAAGRASADIELLSFHVGGSEYCVNIMSVREIRGWTRATALPHAPTFVHGVINLRGTVLPVVDLARRLGLETQDPTERSVIIVVDLEGRTIGMRVDAVSDILSTAHASIQPPPEILEQEADRFLEGLIIIGDRMVRVLNLGAIMPPGTEIAA